VGVLVQDVVVQTDAGAEVAAAADGAAHRLAGAALFVLPLLSVLDDLLAAVLAEPAMTLFVWFIIRFFQFVFSVNTVFFFHNKSVNSVFQPTYQHSRTGP
jgi:hypothetical protein